MSRQCECCFKRILTLKGAYAKHIRYCSSRQQTAPDPIDNSQSIALTQLSDEEFNFNGFGSPFSDNNHHTDKSTSTDNRSVNSNINYNSIIEDSSDFTANRSAWSMRNPANLRFEKCCFS